MSTEAEFVAAAMATTEAIWLRKMCIDLQIYDNRPIAIYEDNTGCIQVAKNPETRRSKHIDTKFHFLREAVWNNAIELQQVSSKDQLTDGLTKALDKTSFQRLCGSLGLKRKGVSDINMSLRNTSTK